MMDTPPIQFFYDHLIVGVFFISVIILWLIHELVCKIHSQKIWWGYFEIMQKAKEIHAEFWKYAQLGSGRAYLIFREHKELDFTREIIQLCLKCYAWLPWTAYNFLWAFKMWFVPYSCRWTYGKSRCASAKHPRGAALWFRNLVWPGIASVPELDWNLSLIVWN